jgi:hypothetical protein
VVKREVDDAAVVSARAASTPSFLHEHPLEFLLPAGDRLPDAPLAAPNLATGAAGLIMKLDPSMG